MKKPLLVFAHKGEASYFLKTIKFTAIDFFFKGLFESDQYFLLLTGQGQLAASEKTVCVLTQYHHTISEIYNLGTAGSLSTKLSVDQIVWVHISVATNEFKSFFSQNSEATTRCISTLQLIADVDSRAKLSPLADIVDMELWAIASAAALFHKPFSAIKYISDDGKNDNFCQEVIKKAPVISEKLYLEFSSRL